MRLAMAVMLVSFISGVACGDTYEQNKAGCYWDAFARTCTSNAEANLIDGFGTGQMDAWNDIADNRYYGCSMMVISRLQRTMENDSAAYSYYCDYNDCYDPACVDGTRDGENDGLAAAASFGSVSYQSGYCFPDNSYWDFDFSGLVQRTCYPQH